MRTLWRQQTANSKQQTANSKQQTANSKQQTANIGNSFIKDVNPSIISKNRVTLFLTEDKVRDLARSILGLNDHAEAYCGVGQITTFNQLGFKGLKGINDKPDGWYLPHNTQDVAIILETKKSDININDPKCIDELTKNINIVAQKYKKIIGILFNGYDVLVFKDGNIVDLKNQLFTKEYYLKLYNEETIDKNLIFLLTKKINDNLHVNFGIKNLNHRMVFTACALVAKRYGAPFIEGMNWSVLQASILSTINKSYENAAVLNSKLNLVSECFSRIQCNYTQKQLAIDEFIQCIDAISNNIASDNWNGEDVMGIFFNEFTRYKGKSEAGQVFTPDHITSLVYRITGTSNKDNVLDACCGSGAFLVKAMSYMIKEVGGANNTIDVDEIKECRLFGVEFDMELYALACANMLIHKDGKTNLIHGDSRELSVCNWIKSKNITKVLMNPPYENKYGCLKIIENVLDNVNPGAICAFILPDNKFEIARKTADKILKKHCIQKIIKLPNIFAGMASVETSIFIIKAHEPQNDKEIFGCWIKEDGLENVKNSGRLDIFNRWNDIENKWVEVIYKQVGDDSIQWIKPSNQLMYKVPEEKIIFKELDFKLTVLKYLLFKNLSTINKIVIRDDNGQVLTNSAKVLNYLDIDNTPIVDSSTWQSFKIKDLFKVAPSTYHNPLNYSDGKIPYISRTVYNNGVVKLVSTDEPLYDGNCIIVGAESAKAFYQEDPFITGNKIYRIQQKSNSILNKYIALYLCTLLNKEGAKYNYSNAWVCNKIEETSLMLPTTREGSPNWIYMEETIKHYFDDITNILV